VDVRRPGWRAAVDGLLADVADLTAALGGTLAGEHGDGRLRTPLMARVWGAEARALFAAVKHACDPAGVLNPGVKVPLPGQQALGDIKYDPALPAVPPPARAALDRVAGRRDYAAFRLALLEAASAGPAPIDATSVDATALDAAAVVAGGVAAGPADAMADAGPGRPNR
jgi:hypothetical protein